MTSSGSAPTPPTPPKNEAEYARKLALALLSTLESKGFLTKVDVDAILTVAHRAALQVETPASAEATDLNTPAPGGEHGTANGTENSTQASNTVQEKQAASTSEKSVLTAPVEVKRPLGPAVLGTRWVKPEAALTPLRTETEDLVHETGAVKIVGQSSGEAAPVSRPLAPAIVTAGTPAFPGRVDADALPLNPDEANAETLEQSGLGHATRQSGELSEEPATDRKTDEKKQAPLVIDFEMD